MTEGAIGARTENQNGADAQEGAHYEEAAYTCFVMMPFSPEFRETYNEAIAPVRDELVKLREQEGTYSGQEPILFRLADDSLRDLVLINSIHKLIEESDFCLADITGRNPNVLYEIGYAIACGKDVIIMTQDERDDPLIADLMHRYQIKYSPTDDGYSRLTTWLTVAVERAIEACRHQKHLLRDHYSVTCFQSRDKSDLGEDIESAMRQIDILQTNLYTIRAYFIDNIKRALEQARDENGKPTLQLRILTLDPDSYFVATRAEQLGQELAAYRDELRENINYVVRELAKCKRTPDEELFSVRIYDDFPTQITFIIDEAVYNCVVARAFRSRELCTFKLNSFQAGVERSFVFHFNSLWAIAKPVTHP